MLLAGAALAACSFFGDAGPARGDRFTMNAMPSLGGDGAIVIAQGHPTLVNVWATWCGPCRREMASLAALDALAPGGLRVVGVSVDRDRNLAQEFVRRRGIRFDNAHDPGAAIARERLGVSRFPASFLVDGEGIVRLRVEGERDWASPEALERIAIALRRDRP